MEATTVIEYLEWVQEAQLATMFRGQGDVEYLLLPSIIRFQEYVICDFENLEDLENELLREFEKYAMPIKDFRALPLVEKLVHAQHYGLPTRLLDWSSNPLKALYFAVEDQNLDHKDGSVIAISPYEWYEGTGEIKKIKKITAFFPELLHERLNSQDGCFTAFPLNSSKFEIPELNIDDYPESIEYMSEITVPRKWKVNIRAELNHLGINHRTMYPGMDGVAKWIKSNLSNYKV